MNSDCFEYCRQCAHWRKRDLNQRGSVGEEYCVLMRRKVAEGEKACRRFVSKKDLDRKGVWIFTDSGEYFGMWQCKDCKTYELRPTKFCPECGRRMRKDDGLGKPDISSK